MANRGADGVPAGTTNYLKREFLAVLAKIQLHHEAESRRNAIQHTALETRGEKYCDIETVGGGVLTTDGGHVLGRKEDYDKGNVD